MKKIFGLLFTGLLIIQSYAQNSNNELSTFINKEVGWTIKYPSYLKVLTDKEIAVFEGRGETAMEETVGEEIELYHTNLLWLMKDQFNSFSSNRQPFDEKTDGPYEESYKAVNEMILETYKDQGIQFDYKFGTFEIDGLVFKTMETKLYTPDRSKVILYQTIFERLIGGTQTLTLNINYNNPMDKDMFMRMIKSSVLAIRE